jgi:hypothetical protein
LVVVVRLVMALHRVDKDKMVPILCLELLPQRLVAVKVVLGMAQVDKVDLEVQEVVEVPTDKVETGQQVLRNKLLHLDLLDMEIQVVMEHLAVLVVVVAVQVLLAMLQDLMVVAVMVELVVNMTFLVHQHITQVVAVDHTLMVVLETSLLV